MFEPAFAGVLMTLGLNLLLPATVVLLTGWALERWLVADRIVESSACQRATLSALCLMPVLFVLQAMLPDRVYLAMPEPAAGIGDGLGTWGWVYASLSVVWFLVAVFLWSRLLGGLWWTRRLLRNSERAWGSWQQRVAVLAQSQSAPTPEVRLSDHVAMPCVVGFKAPVLIVPRDLAPASITDAVLIHELAHLRRRDPWWTLLSQMMTATIWVHPLVWRLDHQLKLTAEEACDQEAVVRSGDLMSYTRALVEFAERSLHKPAPSGLLASNLISRRHWLRYRVRRVLTATPTPTSVPRVTLTAALILIAATASGWVGIHHTYAAATHGYAWLWCATTM